MAPYINEPINSADIVVPMMANVRIAPKLRKKYFYTFTKEKEKNENQNIR